MPQLDFSTFASQIFWLGITFLAFYLTVAVVILPKIRDTLKNRQDKIANDLEEAVSLKSEAEAAKSDFTSALDEAKKEALAIHQETQDKIKAEAENGHEALSATIDKKLADAEKSLATSVTKCRKELAPICQQLAKQMLQKVVSFEFDEKTLDKTLNSLGKKAS